MLVPLCVLAVALVAADPLDTPRQPPGYHTAPHADPLAVTQGIYAGGDKDTQNTEKYEEVNASRSNLPKRSISIRSDQLNNNVYKTQHEENKDLHENSPAITSLENKPQITELESQYAALTDSDSSHLSDIKVAATNTPGIKTNDARNTGSETNDSRNTGLETNDSRNTASETNDSSRTTRHIIEPTSSTQSISEADSLLSSSSATTDSNTAAKFGSDSLLPATTPSDSSRLSLPESDSSYLSVNGSDSSEHEGEEEGAVECQVVPSDLLWYFCGGQQLKVKDGLLMEVVCDLSSRSPLDCRRLPGRAGSGGQLERLEVTDCPLPPGLPLSCVGGRAAALVLQQAPSTLTGDNVRGLDSEDVFINARPGAVREIPVDAIRALPNLKRFRLLQGTNLTLSPHLFPPSPHLQYLEVSMGGIPSLPRAAFASLAALTTLSLFKNNIRHIHPDAFQGLVSLQTLILDDNPLAVVPPGALPPPLVSLYLRRVNITRLEEGTLTGLLHLKEVLVSSESSVGVGGRALAGLPSLRSVSVTGSGVGALPEHLFQLSAGVVNISFSDNRISSLPSPLWPSLVSVRRLDLSRNRIEAFTPHTFTALRSLEELDLSHNHIQTIPELSFSGLRSLRRLSLSGCGVRGLSPSSLTGADGLVWLSLSHNELQWAPAADDWFGLASSPLNMLHNLQELDLSFNNISVLYSDWRLVLRALTRLDLSHNHLAELSQADQQFLWSGRGVVDLSYNDISAVQPRPPWGLDGGSGGAGGVHIVLDHNPFHCDCLLYDFITMVQAGSPKYSVSEARCSSPPSLSSTPLAQVPAGSVTCPLAATTACACLIRASEQRVECDCPTLQDVPDISESGVSSMSLRVRRPAADWRPLPPAVTRLHLPAAGLTAPPHRLPPTLHYLDLSDNSIRVLSETDLQNNMSLRLHGNPLSCACAAADSVRALQTHSAHIEDYSSLACDDGTLVSQKDVGALCDVARSYAAGAAVAVALLLLATALALLYFYRVTVQVLMYRHRCCLFLLPRERDDSHKSYDVFLSFAHADEKFVLTHILPELESYVLHVQGRDWEVGGTIPQQIRRSVERARRTVIILTDNYLSSRWAGEVLRCVHSQATLDKTTRAVTVLVDLNRRQLDRDVDTLLALSTFVRYKDGLFWDRLRFALPRGGDTTRQEGGRKGGGGGLDVIVTDEGKLVNMAYVKDV